MMEPVKKSGAFVKAAFQKGTSLPSKGFLEKRGINETELHMLMRYCDEDLKFTRCIALLSHATLENPDQDSTIEVVEGAHVCNN